MSQSYPRVFVSHNKADKDIARLLGVELLRAGLNVWFDEWEIQAGDSIVDKIEQGLRDCDAFLILMSPQSMSSRWVREELKAVLVTRIEDRSIRVIPILLSDCTIPPLLRDIRRIDLRDRFADGLLELVQVLLGASAKPLLTNSAVNAMLGYAKDQEFRRSVRESLEFLKREYPEALRILFNCGDLAFTMPSDQYNANITKFSVLMQSGLFESQSFTHSSDGPSRETVVVTSVKDLTAFRAFCIDVGLLPSLVGDDEEN